MKHLKLRTLITLTALLLTLLPTIALAESQPSLELSLENPAVQVDQEVRAAILVKDVSPIYGVQSNLTFDSNLLEVVALEHGDFLTANPDQEAFILQNRFDNEAGTVDYALSLLNPAPPAQGSGLLVTIIFRAKANGEAAIEFRDARFGTQTGDEIMAQTGSVLLTVSEGTLAPVSEPATEAQEPAPEKPAAMEAEAKPRAEELQAQPVVASQSEQEPATSETKAEGPNLLLGLGIGAGLGLMVLMGLVGLAVLAIGGYWLARRRSY